MNNLDKNYQNLLKEIIETGSKKQDRTGTGTLSIFGKQFVHDMSEGFPVLTTKKIYFKGVLTELIWFLKGETSVKFLLDNDCNIWNGDLYKNYKTILNNTPNLLSSDYKLLSLQDFVKKLKTDESFLNEFGDFGPIYGKQWRKYSKYVKSQLIDIDSNVIEEKIEIEYIDQIYNIIKKLRNTPDDRRIMLNAWNVSEIDQMILPPCHYGFQIYTRELNSQERKNFYDKTSKVKDIFPTDENGWNNLFDESNIPTRAISLMWNQRSVDTFLGLPFNLASYGLLLSILGVYCGMVPDKLIANLGDTHLYLNHLEQAQEQIKRDPFKLPELSIDFENWTNIDEDNKNVDEFVNSLKIENFSLVDYEHHPAIKGILSN